MFISILSFRLIAGVYSTLSSILSGVNGRARLLLAVSGGCDSVALLHILYSLKEKLKVDLFVVTINHNIRQSSVSKQDADFVQGLCTCAFNEKIECVSVEIPQEKIKNIAKKRRKGIEEAARFLRYKAFEVARKLFNADYVLTAHTKDDFYEGVLMSFFRGTSLCALIGMQKQRGRYIKPFLNIKKEDLKNYLIQKGLQWREDASNASLSYLRNKVRLILFPSLDSVFSGWRGAIDKTIKKLSMDASYINSSYNDYLKTIQYWKKGERGEVFTNYQQFLSMPDLFKMRFLQEGFILVGIKKRVSSSSLFKFINAKKKDFPLHLNGLSLYIQNSHIVMDLQDKKKHKNVEKQNSQNMGYLIWINKIQDVLIGEFILHIAKREEGIFIFSDKDRTGIGPFNFPFCIRSRLQGDVIKIKGKEKKIKSILSKANLLSNSHPFLPIVEQKGRIKALYGGFVGIKSFIGD